MGVTQVPSQRLADAAATLSWHDADPVVIEHDGTPTTGGRG